MGGSRHLPLAVRLDARDRGDLGLREAVEERGGLANLSLAEVKEAVLIGAVHRTRPTLLTEVTAIVGLAPMLWATGTGAELMRPMAAPVLGGMLVSDEVIDLLLSVLFYGIRKRRWAKLHGKPEDAAAVVPEVIGGGPHRP